MFRDNSPWVSLISEHVVSRGTVAFVLEYLFKDVVKQTAVEDKDIVSLWSRGQIRLLLKLIEIISRFATKVRQVCLQSITKDLGSSSRLRSCDANPLVPSNSLAHSTPTALELGCKRNSYKHETHQVFFFFLSLMDGFCVFCQLHEIVVGQRINLNIG